MADIRCKNCGHSAGYHSTPLCGYDHGHGRKPCECPKWEEAGIRLAIAEVRIVELMKERDAYMQAVLDTIHSLALVNKTEHFDGSTDG